MLKKILFIAIFLLIVGCAAEDVPTVEQPKVEKVAEKVVEDPGQIKISEPFVGGNVEFEATAWGYASVWSSLEPKEGAKFLWIYMKTTNIGDVPIEHLPYDFHLEYRGISAQPKSFTVNAYVLPQKFGMMTGWSEEDYFPGTSNEGYLYFEVPADLGDEATLVGNIEGSKLSLKLTDPVGDQDKHLLIKKAEFRDCMEYNLGSVSVIDQACLSLTVINDRHLPLYSDYFFPSSNFIYLNPYADGIQLVQEDVFAIYNLAPFEEETFKTKLKIKAVEGEGWITYYSMLTGEEIGISNQNVKLKVCDECSPETVEVTLPGREAFVGG